VPIRASAPKADGEGGPQGQLGSGMPRPIWNGSISFGLVQIPVGLYPAEQQDELSLTMLDRNDMSPVGYDRINKKTGEKVDWKDIVKGYEYDKGQYVVVTDEDLKAANVEATQTIDIVAFVDPAHIDAMYFDRPYYLAPIKQGRKAYAVLRETLRESDKVGIAKVVIRTRQHLAVLRVQDERLVLQLLRFAHELRSPDELEVPGKNLKSLGVTSREIAMAKQLVEGMVAPWKPSEYHDEYRDDLMARIESKAKAGEINVVSETPAPKAPRRRAQVIDLADLLKRSVEQRRGTGRRSAGERGHRARKPSHRKSA
jgi:DNA end-binding protein Ku